MNDPDSPALADSAYHFCLLGELHITQAGQAVPAPPYRTHGLLAALLLRPGAQRRERLVGWLYPDLPESAGRRRLSDLLWLLRGALPDLPLDASAQEICLPRERRWLDVEAFRRAAAGPSPADWQRALELYRGDLLANVYDDWLLEEREALYLQQVRLLHRTCEFWVGQGRFERALPLAERLIQLEPYDEGALRRLMTAYRQLGRRGAALAAYERFVALAADDLGAEPEVATRALADAIRSAGPYVQAKAHAPALEEGSALSLLQQGQGALERGDEATAQACLQRLRAEFPSFSRQAACLLEVDLALFREEFEHAAMLLEACDPRQAAVLVRLAQLALGRRQAAEATATASEALMLAAETGDGQAELGALLVLAGAQRRLGQGVQAARSAEQALDLARRLGSPTGAARALVAQGHNRVRQGRYGRALSLYHEARSVAYESGLRRLLAETLHWIAWVQSYQGALLDAQDNGLSALSIWRDLQLPGREAVTLQNLAYVYAQLGRSGESLRALERAQALCDGLGEPVRAAVNRYNLADTLLYHDEALAPRAIAIAREALAAFGAHDQPGWQAATLTTLGRALWLAGDHTAALDAFRQAYDLYEGLGELALLPELSSFQALAHLGLGRNDRALDCTRRALLALAQGEVSEEAVSDVYYAHAMALAACGRGEEAGHYLARAYERLLSVAAQLDDEPARQAFFQHSPTTRRLMSEVYARGLAAPPAAGVISRALPAARSGRPVRVRWTVDAGPPDAALKQAGGAIALRRARLSRLLAEAEAQGAVPTVAQLADVLDVSARTIQRDLAAVRREGVL
jgi:DNA-binding SARP family transcriptional activator